MTTDEFGRIVAFVEGAFGGSLPDKARDAWWLLLHGESAEAVMERAVRLAQSDRARYGMPKPGELLSSADVSSRAVIAWHELVRAVEDHGAYRSVAFTDLVLSACVDAMGGWQRVCALPTLGDEARFVQRDFERLYMALDTRRAVGPSTHVGLIEVHNGEQHARFTPAVAVVGTQRTGLQDGRGSRLLPASQTNNPGGGD